MAQIAIFVRDDFIAILINMLLIGRLSDHFEAIGIVCHPFSIFLSNLVASVVIPLAIDDPEAIFIMWDEIVIH